MFGKLHRIGKIYKRMVVATSASILLSAMVVSERYSTQDSTFSVCVSASPKRASPKWNRNTTYCGEDSFSMSENQRMLFLADGVGGWSEMGVDPSEFSWTLAENALAIANSNPKCNALEILSRSYERLVRDSMVTAGSSTACVITLNNYNLDFANLGDSGFLLVRPPSNVIFRTTEQQHAFNTPYQLSYVSGRFAKETGFISDLPRNAQQGSIPVKKGDIVILGTDGLFDNLFDNEILEIVEQNCLDLKKTSETIVDVALKKSIKETGVTPFSRNAQKNGYYFPGGKTDDITVVVARIE
jgi:protein phosphatase PTC7